MSDHTITAGSIVVDLTRSGNVRIRMLHDKPDGRCGLIREDEVVVERADVEDLIWALRALPRST